MTPSSARGAAFGDLNNDGNIEVVINNLDSRPNVLRNRGETKNWILVKVRGTQSNRNGIGARVVVESGDMSQLDEVRSGGSYMSQNDMRLHFGVGDAEKITRINVRWPGGLDESFGPFDAGQLVVLEEGEGEPAIAAP